ncbi:MAG: cell wall-binding repeat-containing protein, partial [Clostridia bacterium]|nr:cell wall-binding repeat-containing protein [Clostridia bacterium]
MRGKGIWSLALGLILLVLLVPANVFAAEVPALSDGSAILASGVNTTGAATVYYGEYAWRVIGYDGEGGTSDTGSLGKAGSMTLLCSRNATSSYYGNARDRAYATSDLREAVDGIANEFSGGEKQAVEERILYGHSANYGEVGYDEDKISGEDVNAFLWPLSVAEANLLNEGLWDGDPEHPNSYSGCWWLRTPGQVAESGFTAYMDVQMKRVLVYGHGNASVEIGVRPAFYVDLESVLFTSAAAGGKSSGALGADALTLVSVSENNEWKLTLLDDAHAGFQIKSGGITYNCKTGAVTVPYSGVKTTGEKEYISALIKDGSGAIKYYGRIAKASAAEGASVTINTGGKLGSDDTLYVFSEQYNGDQKTDYASALAEVPLTFLGHSWDQGQVTKKATCEQDGKILYTCQVCGEKREEKLAATGHSYKTTTTKATLKANGRKETKCSVCGDVKEETVIYYPKTFKLAATSYTFDGKEKKPALTVTDASGKKIAASNYTIAYANNRDAGTATVTVTFKGNYTGTRKLSFTIDPVKVTVPKTKTGLVYNGTKQTGVAAGTNYTVTSGAGTAAKTYTAKATLKNTKNYAWSDGTTAARSIKWTIGQANLSAATIGKIKNQDFTGSAVKPKLTVKMTLNGKQVTLVSGTDYTAKYENNVYAGTATVTVTGKGNFKGTKKTTFKINKAESEATRLSGDNRYATSQAIADAYKAKLGVSRFDIVCVADGRNFPDALAGAYLATV